MLKLFVIISYLTLLSMSFQGCQKSPKANNKSDTLRLSKVTNLPVTNLPVNLYGVKLGESIANKSNNYYISDYTKDPKHLAYMSDIRIVYTNGIKRNKAITNAEKARRIKKVKTDPYSKLLGKEYTGQRELILPQGIYGIMIYIIPSSKIVAGLEFHINPELPDYKQNRAYFNLINNIIPSLLKRYGGIYEKEYEKPTDTIFNRIDRLTINDVVVEAKSTFIQLENFHSFKVTIPSLMNRYKYEIDKYEIKQKEVQNKKAKEQMFE